MVGARTAVSNCGGKTDHGIKQEAKYGMTGRYWYFITSFYCPVCNTTRTERVRMYSERPADWIDRHDELELYDYCEA